MINWKDFIASFFACATVMLFIAAIDQHQKYVKERQFNEAIRARLVDKMSVGLPEGIVVDPYASTTELIDGLELK